jgi:hypothetical protein
MTQNKPSNADRRRIAQEKIAAQRKAEASRQRNVTIAMVVGGVVLLAGAGYAAVLGIHSINHKTAVAAASAQATDPSIDKSTSILASTADQSTGGTVDGVVGSNEMENLNYHIHSHLTIYINGVQKNLPYGVGIIPPYTLDTSSGSPFVSGGSAYYYLHTHDETGIIHIESPNSHIYTLGNFFDVWKQPLTTGQVGPDKGTLTVYVDGKVFTGNPATITLTNHKDIQLDIGTNVPFKSFTWPQGY